jgi:hypothetical protein
MSSGTALHLAAAEPKLSTTVRILAVIGTALMLGVVLELVRRRRLVERYALLWMVVALVLLVLAVWTQLLSWLTKTVGIDVPANFLFLAAFGVGFVLLLHFSVATSRLSEETKILGQEVARLDAELRARSSNGAGPETADAASAPGLAEDSEHDRPVGPQSGSQ